MAGSKPQRGPKRKFVETRKLAKNVTEISDFESMKRQTYESVALWLLVIAVVSLILYRYNQSETKFHTAAVIPFTGYVNSVQLNDTSKLNINALTLNELILLPGISSNIAGKIVNYRNKNPFVHIAELTRINGIGEKKFAVLAELVYCGNTNLTRNP